MALCFKTTILFRMIKSKSRRQENRVLLIVIRDKLYHRLSDTIGTRIQPPEGAITAILFKTCIANLVIAAGTANYYSPNTLTDSNSCRRRYCCGNWAWRLSVGHKWLSGSRKWLPLRWSLS